MTFRYLLFLEAPPLEEVRKFILAINRPTERFGFVVEGRPRKAVRIDGNYEDLVCMALLLD